MLLNTRIPASYVFNKVKYNFIYVIIVSLVVLFLTRWYHDILPDIPLTIPAFIGTAISILLSFKLNQSYDRWWEARKIWGSIVNDSRSLVLQLMTFVSDQNKETIRKMALRQVAWCYSLGQTLRGLEPTENLDQFLTKEDLEYIRKHSNKPLALMNLHGEDLKKLNADEQIHLFSQVQIDSTLVRLVADQGMAERIKSTVFPTTYRLFLHGIIYLFVITLSIALKDLTIFIEVPLLVLISSAFFLLEKTATHMQDPFENRPTDTAMTAIARTIEINIRQLLREEDIPAPIKPESFYLS